MSKHSSVTTWSEVKDFSEIYITVQRMNLNIGNLEGWNESMNESCLPGRREHTSSMNSGGRGTMKQGQLDVDVP